jgi:hypothetical protein
MLVGLKLWLLKPFWPDVSKIEGLGAAAASAYAGIRNANARLAASAATIAQASLPSADTVTISDAARAAGTPGGDLVGALTELRLAPQQTAASVAVLRTFDELSKDLLRTFGERK